MGTCAKGVSQVSQLSQANNDGGFVGVQGVTEGVTARVTGLTGRQMHSANLSGFPSIGLLRNLPISGLLQ